MAQTRRKRKHRGTPAGTIERRGRTSKPPSSGSSDKGAKKAPASRGDQRTTARDRRQARLDTPPTWRGALNRAAFAAAILVIFITLVQKDIRAGIVMGALALGLYIPLSYYTDLALYRRRQRQKQRAGR